MRKEKGINLRKKDQLVEVGPTAALTRSHPTQPSFQISLTTVPHYLTHSVQGKISYFICIILRCPLAG